MKITRTADDVYRNEQARKRANIGCDKCPCCGNNKVDKHIPVPYVEITEGFFNVTRTSYMKDKYSCSKCGAEWESDPYKLAQVLAIV